MLVVESARPPLSASSRLLHNCSFFVFCLLMKMKEFIHFTFLKKINVAVIVLTSEILILYNFRTIYINICRLIINASYNDRKKWKFVYKGSILLLYSPSTILFLFFNLFTCQYILFLRNVPLDVQTASLTSSSTWISTFSFIRSMTSLFVIFETVLKYNKMEYIFINCLQYFNEYLLFL